MGHEVIEADASSILWDVDIGRPVLLVGVDHRIGLERRHVDDLLDWSAEVRSS